jgi:acyl carrier protein phosphodiesterase
MNYLAHLYLSDNRSQVMIGNFIADAVKGKQWTKFNLEIQYGIKMHRFIDDYTDTHPLTSETKKLLYPTCGKYAGAILDILLDYFIANEWNQIHEKDLLSFTHEFYDLLYKNRSILPERFKHMLPYMSQKNWLFNYGNMEGLQRSITNLSKRIVANPGIENSVQVLVENYMAFSNHHTLFWPDLCKAVDNWKKEQELLKSTSFE